MTMTMKKKKGKKPHRASKLRTQHFKHDNLKVDRNNEIGMRAVAEQNKREKKNNKWSQSFDPILLLFFMCFFYIFMVGYKNKYGEKFVQINRDIKCMYELNGCLVYIAQYALSKIGSNVNFL